MLTGYLTTLTSAIFFGCIPLCSKLIYAEGMNSLSLVAIRNLLAIPILLLFLLFRGEPLAVGKKDLGRICLIGVFGSLLTPLLLTSSYQYIQSGTATVLHYVYPSAVVIGAGLALKEKPGRAAVFCVILCTLGMALFYSPSEPLDPKGAALALCSGIVYAVYVLLISHVKLSAMSAQKISMIMFSLSAAFLIPFCLLTHKLTVPANGKTWALCILYSLFSCVFAYVLFQIGARILGGGKAAILSTMEPITSLIVGFLVFDEKLSPAALIGSVLVILASILIALSDMKKHR